VVNGASSLLADDWNGAFGRLLGGNDLRKAE
jgi:hypothetical protein